MMRTLLLAVGSVTLTGAVLTGLVVLVSGWTRRRLTACWHRALLCLLQVFYLVPVGLLVQWLCALPNRGAAGGDLAGELPDVFPAPLAELQLIQPPVGYSAWSAIMDRIPAMLALLWAVGAVLALLYRLLQLRRFRGLLQSTSLPVKDKGMLQVWKHTCKQMGSRRTPQLLENPWIATPMLVNWGNGTALVLPAEPMKTSELYLVFRHELTHARHGDLYRKWIGMLLCCLHWFNPMVYLLDRQLGFWMELACDEAVVERMSTAQRREYGLTILSVLERVSGQSKGICAALCENNVHMKERLSAMLHPKKQSGKTKLVAGLVVLLVCVSGVLVGAVSQQEVQDQTPVAKSEAVKDERVSPWMGGEYAYTTGPVDERDLERRETQEQSGLPEEPEPPTIPDYLQGVPSELLWPVPDSYTRSAGTYENHAGGGVDIHAAQGSDVVASADAIVVKVVRGYTGYGHYVILDHGGGYQTLYAHCNSVKVEVGDLVQAGDVIATVGRTGWATGNHLHIEVRCNGEYMNPMDYIGG